MTETLKAYLIESLRFTKETVAGDATRSIAFLLMSLCTGLSMSGQLFRIISPRVNILHIPYSGWGVVIILVIIILLFWIALAGYCVRIFRGDPTPPSFSPAKILIKDGLLVQIPLTLWIIPVYFFGTIRLMSPENISAWITTILWLAFYFLVPSIVFIYANTGNVIESTRPSKILLTIKTSSWFFYAAAFLTVIVTYLITARILSELILILGYALPVLSNPASYYAILFFFSPILTVFTSRLFTNILMNRGDNKTLHSGNPVLETRQEIQSGCQEKS
jgi:hypothetical protein